MDLKYIEFTFKDGYSFRIPLDSDGCHDCTLWDPLGVLYACQPDMELVKIEVLY